MAGDNSFMLHSGKPIVNSMIVLREEFDDWAILFDPETGDTHGINPVGVFIWKHLDGCHTTAQIYDELSKNCEKIPADARQFIDEFVEDLLDRGYAGYETTK
jgi:SynChlorMet cassette protein ScmD